MNVRSIFFVIFALGGLTASLFIGAPAGAAGAAGTAGPRHTVHADRSAAANFRWTRTARVSTGKLVQVKAVLDRSCSSRQVTIESRNVTGGWDEVVSFPTGNTRSFAYDVTQVAPGQSSFRVRMEANRVCGAVMSDTHTYEFVG